MARLRQLLSGILTLILIVVYSVAEDRYENVYNIRLKLSVEENIFFSECDIDIDILVETNQISLSSENLNILQANINLRIPDEIENIPKIIGHIYDHENKTTVIYFEKLLSRGYYVLHLRYGGFISSKGGFKQFNYVLPLTKEWGKIWLTETHFQPLLVRRIFPIWSELYAFVFNISIEHSNKYSALSNMRIKSVDEYSTDDLTLTQFESTPRLSPYVVSIILTDLVQVADDYTPMWCRSETGWFIRFARELITNITFHLKRKWETFRPVPKLTYILYPGLLEQNRSVVNLGIIIYNEADVIYYEKIHDVAHKFNIMSLIGYEIIQQWLKSRFSSFPSSSWVSTGVSTFFATHVLNQISPNTRIIDLFVVQVQHESFKLDVDKRMLPDINQTETVPIKIINRVKAPALMRMLQHAYNTEKFWKAFRNYLSNGKYTDYRFWKTLEITMKEIGLETFGTEHSMEFWGVRKGYLVLTVMRNYSCENTMNISVENFDTPENELYISIPMSFTTRGDLNFNETQPITWFHYPCTSSGRVCTLNLNYTEENTEDWIIFNIQQTAYYRVNYDDKNWARISDYLNSEDYWKIHVLNRAQLIDDVFHFMLLGRLRSAVFWQLTKYLERETDYIAWYPMFKAMEYISSTFTFHFGVEFMQNNLSDMLMGLLQKITFEEKSTDDDFTRVLRQEAVQWICRLKMSESAKSSCIIMSENKLKEHLEKDKNLSPWWKKWIYCYGLDKANDTTWYTTYQVLNKMKRNKEIFEYLITCPNHLKLTKFISTTYNKNYAELRYKTPEHDIYNDKTTVTLIVQITLKHFVFTILQYSSGDLRKFNFLLENFESFKPR